MLYRAYTSDDGRMFIRVRGKTLYIKAADLIATQEALNEAFAHGGDAKIREIKEVLRIKDCDCD